MTAMITGPHRLLALVLAACLVTAAASVDVFTQAGERAARTADPDEREWIQLFNGRDLTGWTPKFAKHALGENLFDTVRVENGVLEIRYDKWTKFDGEFGHVFYKDPFSYYLLAAEYRFVGEQVPGGPAWARRNNGLMLHSPAPATMLQDQDFPISLEVQLLGGLGDGRSRSTANLCTPGTNVVMNGVLRTEHCIDSTSKTYEGDQWVRVEVLVHGNELVRHIVDGQTVLEYSKPQIGGGNVSPVDPKVKVDGTPLAGGYISIQAETAPTDFRKIELLDLEGCMDPKAANYKRYFVKSNPARCKYSSGQPGYQGQSTRLIRDAADPPAGGAEAASLESPKYGSWGFDMTGMDRSVDPGDDFFKFANGKWLERTEIPADRTRFGNFDTLTVLSENRVHAILEEAAAGRLSDPDAPKIAAAYASFMNEPLADKLDTTPIAPELAEIRAVKTKDDFTTLMGKANTTGFASILPVFINIDAKSPTRYTVQASTGGLGLPDRDYYLLPEFAEKKARYQAYVQQMLTMIGWEQPAEHARAIVDFETRLAEATWTRAERRDRDKTYNPMTPADLNAATPGFEWNRYLAATELPAVTRIVVTTNTAFPKFARIYQETPLPTLQAWQAFKVADGAAPYLSRRFVDANFAFRNKELSGQPEQRARWKRAVDFANDAIGESIGRVYVARYFPPESKAKMDALVGDIRTALKARIESLKWMGADTRARALDKLARFTVKIGYPVKWRDYGALTLEADDLYGNRVRAAAYEWRRDVARLNEPVDKTEWGMTPQTVNAYYNFANNEIVFPAAILQPPFFDPGADPAINYGGIGGVIGHEISHGFDDQGRKSDGDGVLREWWTTEDATKFKAQAERLGAQYSAFEPLPGARVNGALTMGENIGDMGGLSLALDAYHASLKGTPAPVIDGLTGDQRVFLGWAQVWRQKIRDEALRQRLVSDPHSPAYYRVNGTIRNIEGWYQAFDVEPGDKLYVPPAERVRIW